MCIHLFNSPSCVGKSINCTYSVLVHGSPTLPITTDRGLGQGDPFCPFSLMDESLNKLVKKARELEIIKGFEASPLGPIIAHL